MGDYLDINRTAYDATAQEFQVKKELRQSGTITFVDKFLESIKMQSVVDGTPLKILELGPGSGYASMLMCERGHSVTAIEFSAPMAALAQQTAPKATVINEEFTSYDFQGQTFHGILGIAFIHLFPLQEARLVSKKIFQLLRPQGIAMLATTKHPESSEGYEMKTNFNSQEHRFRHRYTQDEFTQLLDHAGFKLLSYYENADAEVNEKTWMNFILTKQ